MVYSGLDANPEDVLDQAKDCFKIFKRSRKFIKSVMADQKEQPNGEATPESNPDPLPSYNKEQPSGEATPESNPDPIRTYKKWSKANAAASCGICGGLPLIMSHCVKPEDEKGNNCSILISILNIINEVNISSFFR